MKVVSLLETNETQGFPGWKKVFLEFQQRLIELDDSFEFKSITNHKHIVLSFERKERKADNNVMMIALRLYGDQDYQLYAYRKVINLDSPLLNPPGGARIFSKSVETVDEAMIYLDRILNPSQ